MAISVGSATSAVRNGSYASEDEAGQAQGASDRSSGDAGGSSAPAPGDTRTGQAGDAPATSSSSGQSRPAPDAAARAPNGTNTDGVASGRSASTIPSQVALSGGTGNASSSSSTPGAPDKPSDVLPGATVAEFNELNKQYDTRGGYIHQSASNNSEIAKRMANDLSRDMTGYPPEVVRFEQREVELQGMLADLPQSEGEYYGGMLATLNTAYRLDNSPDNRLAIERKVNELETVIHSEYMRATNDPVDRLLAVFNAPVGTGYLTTMDRERVDALERMREDFLDAADPVEREAVFMKAAELKEVLQDKVVTALNGRRFWEQRAWSEANGEVDRILKEAESQSDPAKRYELIGRQLIQNYPGHDSLKDRVLLAFTQRMRDSGELRDKLSKWRFEVGGKLNDHSVGAPLRYTDILSSPPAAGPDYVRDLNDQYTDVLRDASHKNDSITPEARAEKLATQILEGAMRVMLELSPVGFLGDLVPSTLPNNVRTGIEAGGMILGMLGGLGIGKQVSSAAKAVSAAAKKAEIDNMAGPAHRTGKDLIEDASQRIVKDAQAEQSLTPEAQLAARELDRKALAEAGPEMDSTSQLAHEAVGTKPYGLNENYADPNVLRSTLRAGPQPGILENEGNRYVEMGGKIYHVRYDSDNGTWRVFNKDTPSKPQFAVRWNDATQSMETHSDVGGAGGGLEDPKSLKQSDKRSSDCSTMVTCRIRKSLEQWVYRNRLLRQFQNNSEWGLVPLTHSEICRLRLPPGTKP